MNCIEYAGCKNADGYGLHRVAGKRVLAHRQAYCAHNNVDLSSIAGFVVRHTCDNPACVNPEHLLLGTHADNVQDKVSRGRQYKGPEHHSSKLTDAQVAEIRARYVPKCRTHGTRALAREFGVAQFTVSQIVNHQIRK